MSVQEKAIAQAIKFLEAAGAEYLIRFGDQEWNKLKPKVIRPDYKSVYGPILKEMQDEGLFVSEVVVPEEFEIKNFRGAVSSSMSDMFGKGNTITECNFKTRTIHLLRV